MSSGNAAGWLGCVVAAQDENDGEGMSNENVVVGFIGLGTMGGRMAANLQKAGFKLIVHDLHRQAAVARASQPKSLNQGVCS